MLPARISVVHTIELAVPVERVLGYLWKIDNLVKYEPKVNRLSVYPDGDSSGSYKASGYFAGLPWNGRFTYRLSKDGFHSELVEGVIRVRGGFKTKKVDAESCTLLHWEEYELPGWSGWIAPVIRTYLSGAIRWELRNIRRGLASMS